MRKWIALPLALCLAALLLTGCGTAYQDEATPIPQAPLEVLPQPSDGNSSTTVTEEGTTIINRGEDLPLPEGFPTDSIPVYAGASCVYTMSVQKTGEEQASYTIQWISQSASADVAAFYRTELASQPDFYEYNGQDDGKAGSFMVSATVDGLSASFMIDPATDGLGETVINLVLSTEAPVG